MPNLITQPVRLIMHVTYTMGDQVLVYDKFLEITPIALGPLLTATITSFPSEDPRVNNQTESGSCSVDANGVFTATLTAPGYPPRTYTGTLSSDHSSITAGSGGTDVTWTADLKRHGKARLGGQPGRIRISENRRTGILHYSDQSRIEVPLGPGGAIMNGAVPATPAAPLAVSFTVGARTYTGIWGSITARATVAGRPAWTAGASGNGGLSYVATDHRRSEDSWASELGAR